MLEPVRQDTKGDDALQVGVELVRDLVGARRVSLMFPLPGEPDLIIVASTGLSHEIIARTRVSPGHGVAGHVVMTGEPLLVNGDWPEARRSSLVPYTSTSFMCIPVALGEFGCGVLNLTDPSHGANFTLRHLKMAQRLVDLVAAVARARFIEARSQEAKAVIASLHEQLVAGQERERNRIARELHDEIGHVLTMAIFRLDIETHKLTPSDDPALAALRRAHEALSNIATTIHNIAFMLRPRILSDLGLIPALRSLVAQIEESSNLRVLLDIGGVAPPLDHELELATFRIIQEALTNTQRHANARWASVSVTFLTEAINLAVEDDGVGIGPAIASGDQSTALGLIGMRERAELLNGSFTIGPRAEGGTIVVATLPLRTDAGSGQRGDDGTRPGNTPTSADDG